MRISEEALRRLRDAIGEDDRDLAEILQSFVDEADMLVDRLMTAVAAADTAKVRGAAHTLKSACRDLGDDQTADRCEAMETDARNGKAEFDMTDAEAIRDGCLELKSKAVILIGKLLKSG